MRRDRLVAVLDDNDHEHPCPVKGCRNTTECDTFHWMTQDEVDNCEGPEPIPCDDHAEYVECDNCGEWAVCTADDEWLYCQPCRDGSGPRRIR